MRPHNGSLREHPWKVFDHGLCPACQMDTVRVVKTEKPIRHMKCSRCKCTWKTLTVCLLYEGALETAFVLQNEARNAERFGFLK